MKEKTTEIGVIIGRFQVHNLHSEHVKLIQSVIDQHDKVIVFLGTTTALGTKKNPLDFITRKVMIENFFGEKITIILPLPDVKNDGIWSYRIDSKIIEVFGTKKATLYGSRDSFIPYYAGNHETKELEPESYISATDIRETVAKRINRTDDFRAGIIYSVYAQYPIMFSTVDIIIRREDELLLGRKKDEKKWRFIGGFVDPTDLTDEAAAKREVLEETGLEVADLKFICSQKINDWRYKGIPDRGIMTHFYEAQYIFGALTPQDDIAELKWFKLEGAVKSIMVTGHIELYETYLKWKNK